MNKENCALKLVDEIILYYDARSKKTSKFEKKTGEEFQRMIYQITLSKLQV